MSGFYRFGDPGEDKIAHLNTGRKKFSRCTLARFEKDNPAHGESCGRMAIVLCDAPFCDRPVCKLHRTKHPTKPNTDYCPNHAHMATPERWK